LFTTRRILLAGVALVVLSVGALWSINEATAAKPPSGGGGGGGPPAILFVSVQQSGWYARDIRGTPETGGSQSIIVKGVGGYPRWRADGARLLFVEGAAREETIVSVAPNGGDRRVLLSFPQVDAFNVADGRPSAPFGARGIYTADWSPDGSCVTFDALTGFVEASGSVWFRHRVYVVRLSDGEIWRVTDGYDPTSDDTEDISVAWSESLNVIGIARVQGDENFNEIWVAAPDGSWSRSMIDAAAAGTSVPYYFDWSHGGDPEFGLTSIAFASHGTVLVAALDLGAAQPVVQIEAITSPGFSLDYPSWSPDDGMLVFSQSDSSKSLLTTHALATGVQKILTQEDASRRKLFAPDWRRIP
jgi:Tol biopolymer transport system component